MWLDLVQPLLQELRWHSLSPASHSCSWSVAALCLLTLSALLIGCCCGSAFTALLLSGSCRAFVGRGFRFVGFWLQQTSEPPAQWWNRRPDQVRRLREYSD